MFDSTAREWWGRVSKTRGFLRPAFFTRTLEVEVIQGRVFSFLARLLSLCLIVCGSLHAQVANNTSLVGTVVEASGSVVAGAKVTAVNVATNDTYTGVTNEEGYYAITFIREGTYQITIEKAGFTKSVQKGILVQANQAVDRKSTRLN